MAPTEKTNADYGSVLPSTQEAEPLKAVVRRRFSCLFIFKMFFFLISKSCRALNIFSIFSPLYLEKVMVEVTAPATLREGYKFIAVYEGKQFAVIVVSSRCVFIYIKTNQPFANATFVLVISYFSTMN